MGRHTRDESPSGRRLLADQLAARRGPLLRVAGWSAVEALPALASGLVVSAAADQGFLAGRPGVGALWLAVLGAVTGVRAWAARAVFPHLAEVVEPLRDALVERVVHGALARTTPDGPAEVARLTEQVESARQLTASLLRTLRGVGADLLAATLGLALLAPAVLPLVLPPLLLFGVLFARLLGPLVERRRALVLAGERMAAEGGRAFAGLRDIAACGSHPRVLAELTATATEQAEAARALGRAAALRSLTVALGGRLPVLLVVSAAPWLLGHHWLSTGQLLGVATYLVRQLEPAVRTLAGLVGGWLLDLAVVLDRLAETGAPTAVPAPGRPESVPAEPSVQVSALRYAHGPAADPVLDGLDLTLAPGEHLAVVGPSGTGKSTLAALLAGMLSPQAGEIRIGGHRPDTFTGRAGLVALLPQEAYVFAGTVRENLCLLSPDTPADRLTAAVRELGAERLVTRLGGPDGTIDDPAALSAGERQLLTLVRTYLSPAPVVVLDEASCHLDPAAEARVEEAFAARPGTLVVVAHRIASAVRADRVLLLDSGRGPAARHGDLQVRSPLYRELVGHWLESTAPARPTGAPEPVGAVPIGHTGDRSR